MARYATNLITACGRSTNQNLSGLGTDSTYTFPDDWYVSSVDSVDINQSAPYEVGQTLDVNVRFSGQGPAFSAIRNNNSNYNIVTSTKCPDHSHNGSSFKVDLQVSGSAYVQVSFNNPFNNATNLGTVLSATFTIQSANDPPNASLTGTVSDFNDRRIDWDASGSSDPDGDSLEYNFAPFNSGNYNGWQTSSQFSYTYSSYSTAYQCEVKVRDGNGNVDYATSTQYTGSGGGSGGSSGQLICSSPPSAYAY